MDRNQNNQGGSRPPQSGSDSRNLGNMDEEESRRARREGGETSSRERDRDQHGQWTGTDTGNRGGSTPGQGQGGDNQGQGGNQGGSHQGGSNQGSNQGGSNR